MTSDEIRVRCETMLRDHPEVPGQTRTEVSLRAVDVLALLDALDATQERETLLRGSLLAQSEKWRQRAERLVSEESRPSNGFRAASYRMAADELDASIEETK